MKKEKLYLLGIIVLAVALRLYNLTAISLWHDEAFSALLIRYPWHEMFYRIALDVHPPAYYVALRIWADIFGNSLFSLRGFSVFFGVAAVYATFLFVKNAFNNEKAALAAALLMATNPFQIQYVTEARMYTFGAFLVMLCVYLMVKAFDAQKQKKEITSWVYWLLFAAGTSLSLYTHYYMFFSAFATGLFGLVYLIKTYRTDIKEYWYFVSAYVLVFLSYVLWLKTFLFQFHQVQNNYWIPKMDKWSIPLTNWRMLFGLGADASKFSTDILLILAVLFSLYVIYRVIKHEKIFYKWLVVFGLIIPFLGAILMSLKQSIFLDRYFLFAALFYTVALAMFVYSIYIPKLRYLFLALLVAISLFNWAKNWSDLHVSDKQGMAGAAGFLNSNVSPVDKLYVGSSFEFFNFKYYNQTGLAPKLYTPGIKTVSDLPHYSGTALLTNSDLLQNFNQNTKPGETVWLLWTTGFGGSKPGVPANWMQIDEKGYQDVRPYPGTWIVVDEYRVR